MSVATVFLRDDDVWEDDEIFLELDAFARAHEVPINYGVIPFRLESRMAKFLRKAKIADPKVVDILQHGYRHVNYNKAGTSKYEFGPGRSYRQQYRDIETGKKLMRRSFGQEFTPVFVPPYHGFNAATLKAVAALGFAAFSAGKNAAGLSTEVKDVPATVPLNRYGADGKPFVLDIQSMLVKARRAIEGGVVTGFVYHHRVIGSSADMRAMKVFLRFLVRSRDKRQVRLSGISGLI